MIWHGHRAVRQAVYDVYGSVEHRDLGSVAADIRKIVNAIAPRLKPGNHIVVRGQIQSMHSAFGNLTLGLLFAAVFVYMLMVVNYQSFLDPLAVLLALPGAGPGILLMLFVAGTTISVPSLMGSIMAIGVASANSILLVTFARELRDRHEHLPGRALGWHDAAAPCADDRCRDAQDGADWCAALSLVSSIAPIGCSP